MPYDWYDYFRKIRSEQTLKEVDDYIREDVWCEPQEVVNFKNWITTEDKIRIEIFFRLLYLT